MPGTKSTDWHYVREHDMAYSEFNFADAHQPEHRSFQFDSDRERRSSFTTLSTYQQPQVE